jgi:hypothetical protein
LREAKRHVDILEERMQEANEECMEPFRALKNKVKLLKRAQQVNTLTRRFLRFDFDLKKLKATSDIKGSQKDYSKV